MELLRQEEVFKGFDTYCQIVSVDLAAIQPSLNHICLSLKDNFQKRDTSGRILAVCVSNKGVSPLLHKVAME